MSQIQDVGKVYDIDKSTGAIACAQVKANMQEDWLEATMCYVKNITNRNLNNIHSIYVRGSVAQGTAAHGYSDLDIIVVVNSELELDDFLAHKEVKEKFPFIDLIDVTGINILDIEEFAPNVGIDYVKFRVLH